MITFLSINKKVFIIFGLILLSILLVTSTVNSIKDYFSEPLYTKESVELMLKHQQLQIEIDNLKKEIEILELDNERIKSNIHQDSLIIFNSSREYRDSLRAILFN